MENKKLLEENNMEEQLEVEKNSDKVEKSHNPFMKWLIFALAVTFSIFQLYTAFFGVLDAHIQRAVHLSFALVLVFLLVPVHKSTRKPAGRYAYALDVVLALAALLSPVYVIVNYQELVLRSGIVTTTDMVIGGLGIVLLLEAARRIVGIPLVLVALGFLAYSFAGPHLPGDFAHQGLNVKQLVGHLYFTTEGVFGIPLGVSSTFIFLFILFGAYLEKTGLGKFFIDLSNAIAGWARGGPAKVAVLSSGLMGTISGSSVANVAGTGSLTIPMMKKLGYKPEFAGAVEAAASTGGQLMPPIMGAASFLMAQFVGIPYIEVVKAAVIPALLYYGGIMINVHLEAKKEGLMGVSREQLPKIAEIIKTRGHLAIPLIAIVYLLVSGYTPMRAALVAIVLSLGAACLRKETRISWRVVIDGLNEGARSALGVIIACATAGVIIGVVTKTGLGLKLGSVLLDFADSQLLPTLFFTMITSIILGMGVPTTANYVITATIAAPTIVALGVPILAAHMFTFYFGIIADITPPVALAAFTGAGIAGARPLKTAFNASKLAIAAFIVPYMFVVSPALLMIDTTVPQILIITVTSIIGMLGISAGVSGYLITRTRVIDRIAFFIGGLLMIDPNLKTDFIGLGILLAGYIFQKVMLSKEEKKARV